MALKIKIEDTVVFQQVSLVLGATRAKIELFKASKTWDATDRHDVENGNSLIDSFLWCNSIQGRDFWDSINSEYYSLKDDQGE